MSNKNEFEQEAYSDLYNFSRALGVRQDMERDELNRIFGAYTEKAASEAIREREEHIDEVVRKSIAEFEVDDALSSLARSISKD